MPPARSEPAAPENLLTDLDDSSQRSIGAAQNATAPGAWRTSRRPRTLVRHRRWGERSPSPPPLLGTEVILRFKCVPLAIPESGPPAARTKARPVNRRRSSKAIRALGDVDCFDGVVAVG